MRHTIITLRSDQCHYPLTDAPPHFFCGEPVACEGATSYCAHHHDICHTGYGKNVAALEEMMYGLESTVIRTRGSDSTTAPVDVVIGADK